MRLLQTQAKLQTYKNEQAAFQGPPPCITPSTHHPPSEHPQQPGRVGSYFSFTLTVEQAQGGEVTYGHTARGLACIY